MSTKFVRGGSDESGLVPIGKRAKEKVSLSPRQREALYRQYLMGEKVADLAQSYNIGTSTAYAYINGERQKEGKVAFTEKVIDGDKRNGRLLYVNSAKHRFEGTHLTRDGEMHRMKFTANNSTIARQKWRKWCEDLDAELEFMDMVERKEPENTEVVRGAPLDHIEEICPAKSASDEGPFVPTDEPLDMEVRPWREVAEEREQEIERLKAELEEAKTQRIEFAEGFQMEEHNPTYLIWTKQPEVRIYGLYLTMDAALKEVDKLNDVAKFLGQGGAFEVEEVAWRG